MIIGQGDDLHHLYQLTRGRLRVVIGAKAVAHLSGDQVMRRSAKSQLLLSFIILLIINLTLLLLSSAFRRNLLFVAGWRRNCNMSRRRSNCRSILYRGAFGKYADIHTVDHVMKQ